MPFFRCFAAGFFLLSVWGQAGWADDATDFFENKVRPVLAEHCQKCHSVGEGRKVKGGLRLDSRANLLKGGDTGPAVVPGEPGKSLMMKVLGYQDDVQMPPKGKLSDAVIADMTRWVKDGAVWPGDGPAGSGKKEAFSVADRRAAHWAWRPLTNPAAPAGGGDPVDRWLAVARQAHGVGEASATSKASLLRRLTFDLTGMPPTPAETRAFLADSSPGALERQIDRLLASPRFGEHWGRHWLDLVRYAETRGHEFDFHTPNAWQYRDYVIRALNADVPYNQMVTEHIAGDLVAKPRLDPEKGFNESVLGTGFFFLGEEVHSPVDVRQDEADRFDNRIDVLGKAFLGLTVACARCHDHKFDAISAADYYALYAVMESTRYRLVRFEAIEAEKRLADKLAGLRKASKDSLAKALAAEVQPLVAQWPMLEKAAVDLARKYQGKPVNDQVLQEIRQRATVDQLQGGWLEKLVRALVDPGLKADDPLRMLFPTKKADGLPAKGNWKTLVDYATSDNHDWLPDGQAFGQGKVVPGDVSLAKAKPGWAMETAYSARRDAFWPEPKIAPGQQLDPSSLSYQRSGNTLITPTFTVGSGQVKVLLSGKGKIYAAVGSHVMVMGPLHGEMVAGFDHGNTSRWFGMNLARYSGLPCRLEITSDDPDCRVSMVGEGDAPASVQPSGFAVGSLLGVWQKALASGTFPVLAGDQAAVLNRLIRLLEPTGDQSAQAVLVWRQKEEALKAEIPPPSRLAPACGDIQGINEKVFVRGSHKVPGAEVPRRYLEAIDSTPLVGYGSGRLDLANKIANPTLTPLVPRVAVNRVWHHLFGKGIVPTVDNFGVLGEEPSHPELLDYLATGFVHDGWSLKKLVRSLVLTRAYALSTRGDAADLAKDPGNQWLGHARVQRLSGEEIRDALLALSGRLDEKQFGEPVPPHIGEYQDGRGKPGQGPLDGAGRRSIYLGVRRNFLSPWMLAFDTPAPFSTMGRRSSSNVPAQSLVLLNDPLVREMCRLWADREMKTMGNELARVSRMALAAYGREASTAEVEVLSRFLLDQAAAGAPEAERLTALAHALVNTREFIFLR